MKLRKSKKPTNKDFQRVIQELHLRLMSTQSQLDTLTKIFSDFLEFTHKKHKFVEYLKAQEAKAVPGSVENPEVKQEAVESV